MSDKLFSDRRALSRADFERYAQELGLDIERFKRDLDDPAVKKEVTDDAAIADKVGATGTPMFYINGRPLSGARPFDHFEEAIEEELKKANEFIKAGTPIGGVYEKRAKELVAAWESKKTKKK